MSIAWAEVAGERLEVLRISPERDRPCLVFLHEGLGSVAGWRDFPRTQCDLLGAPGLVYSRRGYGRSTPLDGRAAPITCIARRGRAAGAARRLAMQRPCWSATATAARSRCCTRRVTSRVRLPSWRRTSSSRRSRSKVFATPARLGRAASCRRHSRDCTTIPTARSSLERWLAQSGLPWLEHRGGAAEDPCPVLAIQGVDDQYATMAQLDRIAAGLRSPCRLLKLANCGHAPQRDQPAAVAAAIAQLYDEATSLA